MPERILRSFQTTCEDGRQVMIHLFERCDDGAKPHSQWLATSSGLRVAQLTKGYYEIVPDGKRLLSTDPDAP
jgi:hypothetical protein